MSRNRCWTILSCALALALPAACGGGDDSTEDVVDAMDVHETPDETAEDVPADEGTDTPTETADVPVEAEADAPPEEVEPGPCDGMTDTNCLEIQVGERMLYRRLDAYETQEIDDDGTVRTVVYLPDLIDEEVTPTPEDYRYQGWGTDGYTYGGYATWDNMLQGYIELGNRRLYWDPSQLLPNSWNVKDTYLLVLSPAGG
ncbi:MAG: hypothetical protein JXB32_16210 [Deltaproteobacteria bacterium]|nr:hypothetical protein [Deltaproteobacteria bacterium]